MIYVKRRMGPGGVPIVKSPRYVVLAIVGEVAYCSSTTHPDELTKAVRMACERGVGPTGKRHLRHCLFWRGDPCTCDGPLERLPSGRPEEWQIQLGEMEAK